ncbi:MAG: YidC/Oxa1 family membrane protein insertase [Patescibacteria group bacterium]|nr:YidC/Oxa1 family membrane protein insertase [Patescibacteria group bacterium]
MNKVFFWISDITKPDKLWLPIAVAVFQFMQMKTISWRSNKKKQQAKPDEGKTAKEQNMAQNMMNYLMPVMVGFIARSLSAGLSLYWIATSVFSTGQQLWMAWRDKTRN